MPLDATEEGTVVDPREAAENAGLRYVSDTSPGISRRKTRTGFSFVAPNGTPIRDRQESPAG